MTIPDPRLSVAAALLAGRLSRTSDRHLDDTEVDFCIESADRLLAALNTAAPVLGDTLETPATEPAAEPVSEPIVPEPVATEPISEPATETVEPVAVEPVTEAAAEPTASPKGRARVVTVDPVQVDSEDGIKVVPVGTAD